MSFTAEQLQSLGADAFNQLGSGDALAENRGVLNSLTPKAMRTLASNLVIHCTDDKTLRGAIRSLNHPENTDTCFQTVLSNAFRVKKQILSLVDQRNSNPHNTILNVDFAATPFALFADVTDHFMTQHEEAIASSINASVAKEPDTLDNVVKAIKTLFPKSLLANAIHPQNPIDMNEETTIERLSLGSNSNIIFSRPRADAEDIAAEQAANSMGKS